jgi:hypothetical protein
MASQPVEGSSNSATTPGVLGTNTAASVPSGVQAPGVNGASTNGVGVSGSTQNASQSAVFGINNAPGPIPSGLSHPAGGGVWGHTKVSGGTGVIGSTEPNVAATGVLGIGNGGGVGVNGTSGAGVGVSGETASPMQNAIFGINTSTAAVNTTLQPIAGCGVWGHTKVEGGTGVVGSTEPNVNATGVLGIGNGASAGVNGTSANGAGVNGTSASGVGVSGETGSASQSAVFGINNATGPIPGGLSHPAGGGVWGHTKVSGGTGVIGSTEPNVTATGVLGIGNGAGAGVNGTSATGVGVSGETGSASQSAVFGINNATGPIPGGLSHPAGGGVWGHTQVQNGSGVIGSVDPNLTQAAGVTGIGNPLAGQFFGNVTITGTLSVKVDIVLTGADFAEDFAVEMGDAIDPGTVMVLDDKGALRPCETSYARKVVGVVSGAGEYKPGLILDRHSSCAGRLPIALVGKVYCRVDATFGGIEVGDLLTTSTNPGHAMRADDPIRAFGAVIGKALQRLPAGENGLIPIIVALQ